jgi:hypothetical protein
LSPGTTDRVIAVKIRFEAAHAAASSGGGRARHVR